jgi:hypothetical protein
VPSVVVPPHVRSTLGFACALVAAVACALWAHGEAAAADRCTRSDAPGQPGPPRADAACWVEITPYPFGDDGNPVDGSNARCRPQGNPPQASVQCYLLVSSLAFRAWDRGLAATSGGTRNPFGVWLWNGSRWFPDPTFPGSATCPGTTVLWAGKLDYWLVPSRGVSTWPVLCRFDGSTFEWQPLRVPTATLARVSPPAGTPLPGAISGAACFAWDNCWFTGSYGSLVRWNGRTLTDASPPLQATWLQSELGAAVARRGRTGAPVGIAVGSTAPSGSAAPLPAQPNGQPPPQLFTSSGGAWSPAPLLAPTTAVPGDPFRTDLVAVDYDPLSGRGWTAGNPASAANNARGRAAAPEPSPLLPLSALGRSADCAGPPFDRFAFSRDRRQGDAYIWSAIGVVPGTGAALAGGAIVPADPGRPELRNVGVPEPVLVLATCAGDVTRWRFRLPDPTAPAASAPLVAASAQGAVRAVAATAPNDAWAAVSPGAYIVREDDPLSRFSVPSRLYRLRDGRASQAPDGDDLETRPLQLQQDPPIIVFAPLPPPEPPPAPVVAQATRTVTLKPALFSVKTEVRNLTLYVRFRLRRPVVVGVSALRKGRVVATTGLRRFGGKRGELRLRLDRTRWPTGIRFLTDAPRGEIRAPAGTLAGTVALSAVKVAVVKGRRVASVRFEVAPAGSQDWTPLGAATAKPYALSVDTTAQPSGPYRLRVVVTDSTGRSSASPSIRRAISNPTQT